MNTVRTADLADAASKISYAAIAGRESTQIVRDDGSVFASVGPNPSSRLLEATMAEDFDDADLAIAVDASWSRKPIERD